MDFRSIAKISPRRTVWNYGAEHASVPADSRGEVQVLQVVAVGHLNITEAA